MTDEAASTAASSRPGPAVWIALSLAVLAVNAAVLVWMGVAREADRPRSLPAAASHGLDADQAACLDFGLVLRRSEERTVNLSLGSYIGLDSEVRAQLDQELDRLVQIDAAHPAAAARLVTAIDEVADESAAVLAASDVGAYRTTVTGRAGAIAAARAECSELAGFDVVALEVREAGRR